MAPFHNTRSKKSNIKVNYIICSVKKKKYERKEI